MSKEKLTPFKLFLHYVALKTHFHNEKYDYFKFKAKTKANYSSFEKRSDKHFFNKLSKHKEPFYFLLANIVYDDLWVGDIALNQEAENNYIQWKKINQSLSYFFEQELNHINGNGELRNIFRTVESIINSSNMVMHNYIGQKISLETSSLLLDIIRSAEKRALSGQNLVIPESTTVKDPLYQEIELKCRKYRPFLKIENAKIYEVIKKIIMPK